jgi:DtxR family Mn-dependent transcriptional regulator
MPTATLEEYLESIYKLSRSGPTRPSLIAEDMSVSAPTVTATLRRLVERGLITRPDGRVELTAAGEEEALRLLRRHRLAERFLVDTLGLPWDDVHDDACLLEHAMTPRVEAALARHLGHPDSCPHGHPIPTDELDVLIEPSVTLDSAEAGTSVRVVSVDERDEAVLAHVGRLGLTPGTVLDVLEVGPFDGSIRVTMKDEPLTLARDVAARIDVAPMED